MPDDVDLYQLMPYVRCTSCGRLRTQGWYQRHLICPCGNSGWRNSSATFLDRFICWVLRR